MRKGSPQKASDTRARRATQVVRVLLGAAMLLGCVRSNGAIEPPIPADQRARPIAAAQAPSFSERDLECLALNVYWEARSDDREGQLAIAHVTMNRVNARAFPDDVCSVVRQGGYGRRHRCQFSWWCDGRSDRPTDRVAWDQARGIAAEVLSGTTKDPTNGALYFHRRDVNPYWARSMVRRCTVGKHSFYADARGA